MSHVSAVLGRIRSVRRSPVPSVTSVVPSHLVEAATVLLQAAPSRSAAEQRRVPVVAAGWLPAAPGGSAGALWTGRPGATTWFG
jgi:hypothetical protein